MAPYPAAGLGEQQPAGQVAEAGTHDELLATGGIYASLWKVQTGEL